MNAIEIGLSLAMVAITGGFGYAIRYINSLTDRIVELEKDIIKLNCKLNVKNTS